MNIEIVSGLILGGFAAAGAAWRAWKGYKGHLKTNPTEAFEWGEFLQTTVPAVVLGFIAGATYEPIPEFLSQNWFTLVGVFFTGGAGVATLQGKLPFLKP